MLNRKLAGLIGIGMGLCLLGCQPGNGKVGSQENKDAETADPHAGHDHAAAGPHGGHLIELGEEEYHAELLHDEHAHTVTVYLLDGSYKEPVAADQPQITLQVFKDGDFVTYTLKADDAEGKFSLVDEVLCDTLHHAEQVKGRLNATIAGKDFVGLIEHEAHDHEEHGHDEGDHEEDKHEEGEHDHEGHDQDK